MTLSCPDCGGAVSARSKTGRCKSCGSRRSANIRWSKPDPERVRARLLAIKLRGRGKPWRRIQRLILLQVGISIGIATLHRWAKDANPDLLLPQRGARGPSRRSLQKRLDAALRTIARQDAMNSHLKGCLDILLETPCSRCREVVNPPLPPEIVLVRPTGVLLPMLEVP